MRYVLDTSVIIKGLIKPRRRKEDSILQEQIRIHETASTRLDRFYKGRIHFIIPSIAVVEIAAVSARLTGIKDTGIETANFVYGIASEVINENNILAECIETAAETKISGFDAVYITCAKVTRSELITDDKGMYDAAVRTGIKAKLLREMTKNHL